MNLRFIMSGIIGLEYYKIMDEPAEEKIIVICLVPGELVRLGLNLPSLDV